MNITAAIILASSLAAVGAIAVEPDAKPRELAKTENYTISVTGVQQCASCPTLSLGLEVVDAKRQQTVAFIVKEDFDEHSPSTMQAVIVGDRAVIVGEGWKGSRIVVLQLTPPMRKIFATRCYHPAISPDGTQVIFESWQLQLMPETQTAVYNVVDITQDPPTLTVLHPISNATQQNPQPYREDPDNREVLVSPISWAKDGSKAALIEAIGDKNEFLVVLLFQPIGRPRS